MISFICITKGTMYQVFDKPFFNILFSVLRSFSMRYIYCVNSSVYTFSKYPVKWRIFRQFEKKGEFVLKMCISEITQWTLYSNWRTMETFVKVNWAIITVWTCTYSMWDYALFRKMQTHIHWFRYTMWGHTCKVCEATYCVVMHIK